MITDQNEILYYEAEGLYDRFDHPDRIWSYHNIPYS